MKIISKLEQELVNSKIDEKIPSLNCGGCGVFALKLGKLLKELCLDFEYIVFTDNWDYDDYKKGIVDVIPCHHVMIHSHGKFIDSRGFFKEIPNNYRLMYDSFIVKISENELKNFVSCRRNWNPQFDRRNNKTISSLLNDIKKKLK